MNSRWQIQVFWRNMSVSQKMRCAASAQIIKWIWQKSKNGMMDIALKKPLLFTVRVRLWLLWLLVSAILIGTRPKHLRHCADILTWILMGWKTMFSAWWPEKWYRSIQVVSAMIWRHFTARMMSWLCWFIWDILDTISAINQFLFRIMKSVESL